MCSFFLSQADSIQNTLPPVCATKVHINISQTNLSKIFLSFFILSLDTVHTVKYFGFFRKHHQRGNSILYPFRLPVWTQNILLGVLSEFHYVRLKHTHVMILQYSQRRLKCYNLTEHWQKTTSLSLRGRVNKFSFTNSGGKIIVPMQRMI